MAPSTDLAGVSERIESLLGELADTGTSAPDTASELVRALMEFYGGGLARIVEQLDEHDPGLFAKLAADPVVTGLLVLHDLHPRSTHERVAAALDEIRPYLGAHAGDVELLGIDEQGVVRLQLTGNCDGCPSSTITAKYAIEKAVRDAAPEIEDIDVAGVAEPGPTVPAGAGAGPDGRHLLPLTTLECPVPEPR